MPKWPTTTKWPYGSVFPNPLQFLSTVQIVEWWRGDLGVDLGSTYRWTGQFGGTVALQATAANQPAYVASSTVFNGKPCFTGDGVNDTLGVASFVTPAPGTTARYYWIICSLGNAAPATSGVILGSSGFCQDFFQPSGGLSCAIQNGATGPSNTGFAAINVAKRCEAYFSNTVSDFLKIGSTNVTGVNTLNNSSTGIGMFAVGTAAPSNFWAGSIAEIIITNGLPSNGERASLDTYANTLYGSGVTA